MEQFLQGTVLPGLCEYQPLLRQPLSSLFHCSPAHTAHTSFWLQAKSIQQTTRLDESLGSQAIFSHASFATFFC